MSDTVARNSYRPSGEYRLQIAGGEVSTKEAFDSIDPSVGDPWARIPQAGPDHLDSAVAAARSAFRTWRRTSPSTRQDALWRLADAIEADRDRWALLLATENGRPIREAIEGDIPTATGILRYFAGVSRGLHGEQIPTDVDDALVYTTREPLGVVASIIPWNSPLITVVNKVAPALATGNTVVVKPSEFASASALEFARVAHEILPDGVVNVVTGFGPELGAALVSHRDIAKVSFTGGTQTARAIMSAAGQALTPTIMELGGKGAMVVCEDADLELAAIDAVGGIYSSNGQICVAASRLLVHRSVHDEFAQRFAEIARGIRIGDATDPATEFGPLVSRPHHERVNAALARAVSEGAQVLLGGDRPALGAPLDGGFYLNPTLLDDPDGGTSASRDEFFGPVAVLECFDTESEAIARANETRYGLACGVWTRDLGRAHRIARELDAGIVWVNKWLDLAVGVPMGGVKDSGFGREVHSETLLEYSAPKVVNIDLGTTRVARWSSGNGK